MPGPAALSVQLAAGAKAPEPPVASKATSPVGEVPPGDSESATVTVQVAGFVERTRSGSHSSAVVEPPANGPTSMAAWPVSPEWEESPPYETVIACAPWALGV